MVLITLINNMTGILLIAIKSGVMSGQTTNPLYPNTILYKNIVWQGFIVVTMQELAMELH